MMKRAMIAVTLSVHGGFPDGTPLAIKAWVEVARPRRKGHRLATGPQLPTLSLHAGQQHKRS